MTNANEKKVIKLLQVLEPLITLTEVNKHCRSDKKITIKLSQLRRIQQVYNHCKDIESISTPHKVLKLNDKVISTPHKVLKLNNSENSRKSNLLGNLPEIKNLTSAEKITYIINNNKNILKKKRKKKNNNINNNEINKTKKMATREIMVTIIDESLRATEEAGNNPALLSELKSPTWKKRTAGNIMQSLLKGCNTIEEIEDSKNLWIKLIPDYLRDDFWGKVSLTTTTLQKFGRSIATSRKKVSQEGSEKTTTLFRFVTKVKMDFLSDEEILRYGERGVFSKKAPEYIHEDRLSESELNDLYSRGILGETVNEREI